MTYTLRCVALMLVLPLVSLTAQDAPFLESGSRVRVTNSQHSERTVRVAGALESIDSNTIVVRRDNGERVSVPRLPYTQFEVSNGPGACSGGRRGGCVAIGFLGGTLVGVLAAVAGGGTSGCSDCGNGLIFLWTVPAGALVGTVIGAVVGGEHWQSVTPRARLSIGPNDARGLRLGLSLPL